jgi:hypothetical protein
MISLCLRTRSSNSGFALQQCYLLVLKRVVYITTVLMIRLVLRTSMMDPGTWPRILVSLTIPFLQVMRPANLQRCATDATNTMSQPWLLRQYPTHHLLQADRQSGCELFCEARSAGANRPVFCIYHLLLADE